RSRSFHERSGAARLPTADLRARPFHGRAHPAARGLCRSALVRPHGPPLAHACAAGRAPVSGNAVNRAHYAAERTGTTLCAWRRRLGHATAAVRREPAHLRPGAL